MKIVLLIAGIVIGYLGATAFYFLRTAHGEFLVNTTDPTKDIYRLVVDEDFESLARRKRVVLKVSHK